MAIIEQFKIDNVTIYVDNSSIAKTEKEERKIFEEFSKIGLEILYGKKNKCEY